jgi:hypothetical protein
MTETRRITVLAGAGLCKDAGLPTSTELAAMLQTVLVEVSTSFSERIPQQERHRAKLHLATYRFLNGAIRFQQGILDQDPSQQINIEQIAVAAEELQNRAFNPLSPYTSGWHDRLVELERQAPDLLSTFTDFIYSQLEHWLELPEANVGKVHYIRNLADVCNDGYGLDIFTLNYDLCVETALTIYAKKKFENGFTEESGWQPDSLQENAQIRLFKLHGSLDWVEDSAYGLCSLRYPRHKYAENIEGENVKPLLIFGTAHKLTPREPFLSLAYTFSQTVLATTVLVIIGYSFGDEYVNQIVRQGIEKNPKLRVLVIAPGADTLVAKTPFLQGRTPRVVSLALKAAEALAEGRYLRAVRDLIAGASSEEPFKEPNSQAS